MTRTIRVSRKEFLEDSQGKTFVDVVDDPKQPFQQVLEFFCDADRQRRMEEAELHHDRSPLAGVIRELEVQPEINRFLSGIHTKRSTRFRQAIGVLVRIIMQRRGWQKTGRKGSLGVRAAGTEGKPAHNSGGLAFWFVRRRAIRTLSGHALPIRPRTLPGTGRGPAKIAEWQASQPDLAVAHG